MKYLYVLFLISSISYSQNLTIAEIAMLRNKNVAELEEYLTTRDWTYLSGEAPSEQLGKVFFVYQKSEYNDRGQSFIYYFYSDDSDLKRLEIQVFKKEIYSAYLKQLSALGCKLITSKVIDGNIVKFYQGKTTTFEIQIIAKPENGNTENWYRIVAFANKDYEEENAE